MNSFLLILLLISTFGQFFCTNNQSLIHEKSPEILFCTANREIRMISLNDSLLTKPNVYKRRRDHKRPERMRSNLRNRRNGSNGGCNNDIDYDISDNYVIWSNISSIIIAPLDRKIKNRLNINSKKIVVKTNDVQKISLDWIHDLLYYIESGEIKVISIRNQNVRTLSDNQQMNSNNFHTVDIVVNPIESFIAWIRWDRRNFDYKLMKADQNGANQKILLDLGFYGYESQKSSPCCLAIDYQSHRIYYIDNKSQTLESVLFDGTKKTNHIFSSLFAMTNSIDLYGDYIFWSNRGQNSILATHKFGKSSSIRTILRSEQNIDSLRIVHKSKQPLIDNRCHLNKCTDLCIPVAYEQYICVCDDHNTKLNKGCNESHYIVSNITTESLDLNIKDISSETKVHQIMITENDGNVYPLYVFKCHSHIEKKSNESLDIDWYSSDNQRLSEKYKKTPIAKNITKKGKDVELRVSYPFIKQLSQFKCKVSTGNQSFETIYKVNVRQIPTNPKISGHSLSFAGLKKVYLTLQIDNMKIDPPIDKYRIAYRGIFNFYQQEYWLDFNALSANDSDRNTIYVVKLDVDYTTQDLLAFKLYAHNEIGWSSPLLN